MDIFLQKCTEQWGKLMFSATEKTLQTAFRLSHQWYTLSYLLHGKVKMSCVCPYVLPKILFSGLKCVVPLQVIHSMICEESAIGRADIIFLL